MPGRAYRPAAACRVCRSRPQRLPEVCRSAGGQGQVVRRRERAVVLVAESAGQLPGSVGLPVDARAPPGISPSARRSAARLPRVCRVCGCSFPSSSLCPASTSSSSCGTPEPPEVAQDVREVELQPVQLLPQYPACCRIALLRASMAIQACSISCARRTAAFQVIALPEVAHPVDEQVAHLLAVVRAAPGTA